MLRRIGNGRVRVSFVETVHARNDSSPWKRELLISSFLSRTDCYRESRYFLCVIFVRNVKS